MAKNKISQAVLKKANKIKLLAMDVDGVLTGGEIIILNNGEEIKIWSVKDRMGFAMLRQSGLDIKLAWISARGSEQVQKRGEDLKVDFICLKCPDKWLQLQSCAKQLGLKSDQIAYIGDDFVDLRALKNAGLSVCPPESPQVLKNICDYQSQSAGGKGVVREVIEILLKAQGKWKSVMQHFSSFVLVFALGAALMLTACSSASKFNSKLAEKPDQTIENFTITETSQGLPLWDLQSRKASIYNAKQKAVLEEVSIRFLEESKVKTNNPQDLQRLKAQQKISAYLTALHGQVQMANNDLSVWGNVVVETKNGTHLFTEKLKYSTQKQRIYTDSAVKIVRQDSILMGEGMEATSDLSDIKIFRHQAWIEPQTVAQR